MTRAARRLGIAPRAARGGKASGREYLPGMATTVREHMSVSPYTIGKDQTLAAASRLMRKHNIRHLPVLEGGALLGILSVRDVYLVQTLADVDEEKVTVEEAMTAEPFAVAPDTALADVVTTMAERKYGTAVVMEGRDVVGIFTTIDALNVLAARL